MTQLFSDRKFVDTFSTRNVVFESYAGFDKAGDLVLRTCMEFAHNGRIKRTKVIKTTDMSVHAIHTAVGEYQAEVLDIINVLEDYVSWVRSGKVEVFSEFIGTDESPLYFHGHCTKGYPSLFIFGQELHSLELYGKGTLKSQGEKVPYIERIESLAECYREHLKALDAIPANAFKGAYVERPAHINVAFTQAKSA